MREPDAPPEDEEASAAGIGGGARGTLIHRVLELLHRDLADAHGEAALSGAALRRADRLVPHLVGRALAEAAAEGRGVPFGVRAVVAAELAETVREYVAWEVAENEKAQRAATPPRRPVAFEVAFGVGGRPPVTLTQGGRTLRLRGRIDRVDALVGDAAVAGRTYVVDYKTSKASLTPVRLYEDGAILQLPLYVHALGRLTEGGAGVWGGAYQVVRNGGERPGALHPSTLVKGKVRRGELKGEQEAEARLHDALAYALLHVDGVVAGAFPARIPASTPSCPPFCAVRDACREVRA